MLLITDYGVTSYDIGTGFGHLAIATEDVSVVKYLLILSTGFYLSTDIDLAYHGILRFTNWLKTFVPRVAMSLESLVHLKV